MRVKSVSASSDCYVGIDVGTGSARAGVFDANGDLLGRGEHPIRMWHPAAEIFEQSTSDIWTAVSRACQTSLRSADITEDQISGLGFDATCSLVALGPNDESITISLSGERERNVIVWMDHRASGQAARINADDHRVLEFVGGSISPEMEVPKLLWIKEHLPETWRDATGFFDLADFLTYRATGSDLRSSCTTVCKWTYLGHETTSSTTIGRWDGEFFRRIGLADLVDEDYTRIGRVVGAIGEEAGRLTSDAAAQLGLRSGIPVAVSSIDAYAGGIGLLGTKIADHVPISNRLALICGTSSCHIAVSEEADFIDGVWGPYFSVLVPGMWVNEAGQSATGALLDYVIESHPAFHHAETEAKTSRSTIYEVLNSILDRIEFEANEDPRDRVLGSAASGVHVLPDFHGNRSPRADPDVRGMMAGLTLSTDLHSLAVLYLATIQGIAYGTRHIVERFHAHNRRIEVLLATGGDAKNHLFLREHSNATGLPIAVPDATESVLRGSAITAAVAARRFSTISEAMEAMSPEAQMILPAGGATKRFHDSKYQVFNQMYEHQMDYRATMAEWNSH